MAGMAWKVGKTALQKFDGKNSHQDSNHLSVRSVDHSHYQGPKVKCKNGQLYLSREIGKHRKNSLYYEYLGIPKEDAKGLSLVVFRARFMDNGIPIGCPPLCYRVGVNNILGLVPEGGIFIGWCLSYVFIYRPAKKVCRRYAEDTDALKVLSRMRWNLGKMVGYGIIPYIGDVMDRLNNYNVKNADALEAMLLKRVKEGVAVGRDAEKVGRTTGYPQERANEFNLTASNGYHPPERPSRPPGNFITEEDLYRDPAPAAIEQAPMVQTQSKKGVGNFFRRHGDSRTKVEEVAPGRPPRPERSHHQHGGRF